MSLHTSLKSFESIRHIPGVYVGHATLADAGTGCTAIVCPAGAVGAVDVRGGAPATRETDLLRPEETVQTLDAVVLSGGSAFGLAASCGVAEELERRGIGVNVGVGVVPIVSSACLFDLACGSAEVRPGIEEGIAAVRAAFDEASEPLERGNVGAGTGCSVGKIAGPARTMKSGLGEAVEQAGELVCAAVVAVNAAGDIVDPDTHEVIAGVLSADGGGLESSVDILLSQQRESAFARSHGDTRTNASHLSREQAQPRTNTTLSCVVTNARLNKAEATKVAQMAADGYAHAILPTHTTNDGDTIFVMATGQVKAPVDVVGVLAAQAISHGIVDGVRSAKSAYGYVAARDLEKRRMK